ncbi:cytochrome C oxidase subunit IV [Natronospirillum operosum]|uniref:Cytochrome C oxidase subunit IV n=1 Tax=Natronospirillum operosum TaxID=2759953 RepID=A0A4Z0WG21_9GAMM|nr:cytochrome C oxidase subunit IV family protein [Natronospirillum operosum]TGG95558.1 cytochrome C oxidase subunit IV [Natronospirillum operosum]
MTTETHHTPPISLFLKVWGLLFVLSFFSYLVEYIGIEGFWRWTLVLFFMVLKAWVILRVFMHVKWERLSLQLLLGLPTLVIFVLVAISAIEGNYIHNLRLEFFFR